LFGLREVLAHQKPTVEASGQNQEEP
jgi:hypothetical protein